MTTKDLPKWFWATFEQVDNPVPEIADRDRYTNFLNPRNPDAPYVEQRLRAVPDPLKNTVWQYYVLRGTQVDFIDSVGNPIILGNTQLEGSMQTSSSCMGCHARSTIGDRRDHIKVDGHQLYPRGAYFFPEGRMGGVEETRLAKSLDGQSRAGSMATGSSKTCSWWFIRPHHGRGWRAGPEGRLWTPPAAVAIRSSILSGRSSPPIEKRHEVS